MSREVSASADDARRRSDDGVRRLREESARRVEQRGRVKAFSSWCALATLAGGISIAALNADDARLQEQEALRAVAERDARIAHACTERSSQIIAITSDMLGKLAVAKTEEERTRIRGDAAARKAAAIDVAADKGCGSHVSAPASVHVPERAQAPEAPKPYRRSFTCGGDPPGGI